MTDNNLITRYQVYHYGRLFQAEDEKFMRRGLIELARLRKPPMKYRLGAVIVVMKNYW